MGKFTRTAARKILAAPLQSTPGAKRFAGRDFVSAQPRELQTELFLLAVSNLVGENAFYEHGGRRDRRFVELVHAVAARTPDWVARFVPYLREKMLMRSASIVMAAEYVASGAPGGRAVVASALRRADEPAEMLAYWAQTYGRPFPARLRRGVADAVRRVYTERSALRYDGRAQAWRFGDVIELTHPAPRDERQAALFRYLLDSRHRGTDAWSRDPNHAIGGKVLEKLPVIRRALELERVPVENRRAVLRERGALSITRAGFSWQRLSGWLPGGMDAEAWEAVIPSMGYMALLRNLRNFDDAGVSDEARLKVAAKLMDPDEVASSKQLPIRFYSAYRRLSTLHWGPALERALDLSVANVPVLRGRTLILIDVSGSMIGTRFGNRSALAMHEQAALFGVVLAKRAESADVYAYSADCHKVAVSKPASILRTMEETWSWPGAGQSTATHRTLAKTFAGHDRVVILTDEQATDPPREVNEKVPLVYTFNLVGYGRGHISGTPGRFTIGGGFTDQGFTLLEVLEDWRNGRWPF